MYKFSRNSSGKKAISTTVSIELDKLRKKHGIKRSYALSYGIRKLLGMEVVEPDNEIKELKEKIEKMSLKIGQLVRDNWKNEEEIKDIKETHK